MSPSYLSFVVMFPLVKGTSQAIQHSSRPLEGIALYIRKTITVRDDFHNYLIVIFIQWSTFWQQKMDTSNNNVKIIPLIYLTVMKVTQNSCCYQQILTHELFSNHNFGIIRP